MVRKSDTFPEFRVGVPRNRDAPLITLFQCFNLQPGLDVSKADVFSVGMVVYITGGVEDVWGSTPRRSYYPTEHIPKIPGLSDQAATTFRSLLCFDPADRLSAAAAIALLSACTD